MTARQATIRNRVNPMLDLRDGEKARTGLFYVTFDWTTLQQRLPRLSLPFGGTAAHIARRASA